MTVAAVILAASEASALTPVEGLPRIRRLADIAWSGGALPIIVVAGDPDEKVARALDGAPVTLADPAPEASGPVGQIVRGIDLAVGEIDDTDAALIWPARMVWVGPESVTSLIEAHGVYPGQMLRPAYQGKAGWPTLLPIGFLPALRALPADRMPDDLIDRSRGPGRAHPDARPGRPGHHVRRADDSRRAAGLRRAGNTRRRPYPRVGRNGGRDARRRTARRPRASTYGTRDGMNGGRAAGRTEAQAVARSDAPQRDHEILMAVAVGARLFRAPDLDIALNETLAALGRAAGVTRAFLFHIVGAPGSASAELTHEWTAPGIPSLLGNPHLRGFVGGPDTATMADELAAGRPFVLKTALVSDRMRSMLESIGSRTVLMVPVEVNGVRGATIGFDESLRDRDWGDDEVAALAAAGALVGAAIGARQTAEALRSRDAILESVAHAGERFMRGEPVDEVVDEIIGRLGKATRTSRVVLVERRRGADGSNRMLARHAWAARGVPPLAASPDNGGFHYFPRWERELAAGRFIAGNVAAFPDDERRLLQADEVRSIVVAPVAVGGHWWGHLGFDDSRSERTWSALETDALRAAAGMIGAALQQAASTEAVLAAYDRLREVQRMDAVGRLAGGLAHDFNNVLTVVDGHARFLLEPTTPEEVRKDAESIMGAVQRGTALTRQLMAFSRKRIDELAPVDINRLVEQAQRMIERLVGPAIDLEVELTPDLPEVMTDAVQFGHVLVNLAANARDAMPDGGTLSISTRRDADPRFVELIVRDTGTGMDEPTQARIFEPLFTTKPLGRGTGFGLATALAVVAGSGGRITVASRPGEGAAFTIRLPLADAGDLGPGVGGSVTVR